MQKQHKNVSDVAGPSP